MFCSTPDVINIWLEHPTATPEEYVYVKEFLNACRKSKAIQVNCTDKMLDISLFTFGEKHGMDRCIPRGNNS